MNSESSHKTPPVLSVIGAGPMGLSAAYYAAKNGYSVDVYESDDRVGGMAAHFDFDGLSIERFYHFCCLSDDDTLELIDELGLRPGMRWVTTTMGLHFDGQLYDWGNPLALLRFPKLNFIEKVRYGLLAFVSTKRKDWSKLDQISAEDWFVAWCGRKAYEKMWKPLLDYKFYELAPSISAAWMWQRIKRLGNSRKSLFEERLGFIEGGSEALMEALAQEIRKMGGRIHLSAPVASIDIENSAVTGLTLADGRKVSADRVISTVPTPAVAEMLKHQPESLTAPYRAIDNIGCVCVMLKLSRPVTSHFWVNISRSQFEIPGIVEFSNLRDLPESVVYVPFYMPNTHQKFTQSDAAFVSESLACLQSINPKLQQEHVLATHVGRLSHAQPICDIGFADKVPDPVTPIAGLQIADTSFYYPEDRGVSESIRFAKKMVRQINGPR